MKIYKKCVKYKKIKSKRSWKQIKIGGGVGGFMVCVYIFFWFVFCVQGCGGGEVSGGGTLYMKWGADNNCHKRGLRGKREIKII